MKIALIGYGKMGKEIESIALERNHEIITRIDQKCGEPFDSQKVEQCDVAIEFTAPESAYDNYINAFKAGVPVVSGTTGWLDKLGDVKQKCNEYEQAFFYASNFSLGVNVFFEINRQLAKIMNNFEQYDIELEETHHTQKLDAPSGTAISLAEDIIKKVERKSTWVKEKATEKNQLPIRAKRIENVPGIHEVIYDSDIDFIQIKHSAKSRKGFALGAVLAAEFLKDKKGIYGMKDLLNL